MNTDHEVSGIAVRRGVRSDGLQIANHCKCCPMILIPFLVAALAAVAPLTAAAQQQWSADLVETANYLVQEGKVHLSGNISCELHGRTQNGVDAYVASDAKALLNVASHTRIYLFLHGFYVNLYDGRPPMEKIRADWRTHINLIRRHNQDFVACLFIHDTAAGFGNHQPSFGNFLFALRWLTDDPELHDPDRRIYIVTHSAGFGYAKYGYLLFSQTLAKNGLGKREAALTPMRFIFLAAPHFGTETTGTALMAAGLFRLVNELTDQPSRNYEDASRKRFQERKAAAMLRMATSRGARQLLPGNQLLRELDSIFQATLPDNAEIFNFYSLADMIVSSRYSRLSYGKNITVVSMGHSDFLASMAAGDYARLLSRIYAR